MKILRVIASMNPESGGPCQGIRNSIAAMSAQGILNEVVSLDNPYDKFLGEDEFKIHPLGPTSSPWAYSKLLIPWLYDNIHRFDAIIVHGLWLYPTYAMMKAMESLGGNSAGKKLPSWYIMPHGMLDPYFQKAPERRLKSIRNRIYWSLIEEKVIRSADAVLFTCQQELLLARETFSTYRPKQAWNVGYGIQPPPEFNSTMSTTFEAATGLNANEKFVLFLSRIHPKKGVDLLVDSYALLLEKHKGNALPKLVIAGPGIESDFGKQLLDKVSTNERLKKSIVFPGMLSGNSKWGAFYHADAFILPSHQENFGIAVAEAMACSTPVLISDQINIWREIADGKAGLIESDTLAGTSKLLEGWLQLSDAEQLKMANQALHVYEDKFKITSNIKTMLKFLSTNIN